MLVRHSQGVDPTKAGKLLYARTVEILKLVEETRKRSRAPSANTAKRFEITPALMLIAGTELAITVRQTLPQVLLSIAEAMSHVLIESLMRREVDFILCYDVPDLPQFSRTALLQDDLVLVTQPGPHKNQPITFAGRD